MVLSWVEYIRRPRGSETPNIHFRWLAVPLRLKTRVSFRTLTQISYPFPALKVIVASSTPSDGLGRVADTMNGSPPMVPIAPSISVTMVMSVLGSPHHDILHLH